MSAPTHRMSNHPAYRVWWFMRQRCENANLVQWPSYGGRGIKVCAEWQTFTGFWADMGAAYEPGLTLDRTDNDGDYCAANCRWVDRMTQQNNTRWNNRLDTPKGNMTVSQASREFGVPKSTIRYRLKRGAAGV